MSDINQHTPNKHAYLIIAHTNWNQLNKLVRVLDDLRNDLYIHIDQKSLISFNKTGGVETRYSNVYVVNSFDVRWGHVSQIKAEIELFEKSSLKQYSYYHLISGMDLPLHNQDYIHKFFETNQGYEFIGFGNKNWDVRNRVHCHNFCVSFLRSNNMFIRYTARFLRKMFNRLQVLFHVHINSFKSYLQIWM